MMKLAPTVIEELRKRDVENIFLHFFQLVNEDRFPLDNIAFRLWIELVRWYKLDYPSGMRYQDETKKFWKLGWRLFGGKFIRFMSGFKTTAQVISGDLSRRSFDPKESDVNFIVPDVSVLRNFMPYGTEREKVRAPGIYTDVIKEASKAMIHTSACLSFDGKKLKQGLTDTSGDVNLLGFEDGIPLPKRQQQLKMEIEAIDCCIRDLSMEEENMFLEDLPVPKKESIHRSLHDCLRSLGKYAQQSRKTRTQKEYAMKKFIERSGPDWRNGQLVYVISAIKAFLYDITCFLEKYERHIDQQGMCMASLATKGPESPYVIGKSVSVETLENYCPIPEVRDNETEDTRKIKQRTPRWHEIRSEAKVSGSTIYRACGLDTLRKQQIHFDNVVCGIEEREATPEVQSNMNYGTENEINAASTLVSKILPALFPQCFYYEEGCVVIKHNDKQFMVVSPDGSIRQRNENGDIKEVMGVEFKCPVMNLHDAVPERYLLQCLLEMEALDVDKLLYVCWRPDFTSVFEIHHDKALFQRAFDIVSDIFVGEKLRRPSKTSPDLNDLRSQVRHACKSAEFIGEFVSAQNVTHGEANMTEKCAKVKDLLNVAHVAKDLLNTGYELQRQRASEAMVFLCCDLDRNWSKDPLRWAPICWFPKGHSLTTGVFRRIVEETRNKCHEEGMHVPCSSFDGQWHNISVRDELGKPRTLLQLQKDVWAEAKKLQKSYIVQQFRHLNKTYVSFKEESSKVLVLSNGNMKLPKLTSRGWKEDSQKNCENEAETPQMLSEVIPEEVAAATKPHKLYGELLQYIESDKAASEELLSCNAQPNSWIAYTNDSLEGGNGPLTSSHSNDVDSGVLQASTVETNENSSSEISNGQASYFEPRPQAKENPEEFRFSKDDCDKIVMSLRTDKTTNAKGIWNDKDGEFLLTALQSHCELLNLRDVDLKVVMKYVKNKSINTLKLGVPKQEKIALLCQIQGLQIEEKTDVPRTRPRRQRDVKRLSECALKVLIGKSVPKLVLNIAFAEFIWEDRLQKWRQDSFLSDTVKVDGFDYPNFWFYTPEYSTKRNQLEVSCIDSSHLLTRTRRKICKGGIEGFSNQPWVKVARSRTTLLTPVMVEDIVDPMSVPMAVTHFCQEVEQSMRNNGDHDEAMLCQHIRSWWRAEDEPGIPANDRIRMRMELRKRLLKDVSFGSFPPPTVHVSGWPIQLWEALIANIDAKAVLYSLSKRGTYNVRAFSSMMGETFFSEVANQDKRGGKGTLTADEFAHFMNNSMEQMRIRLDEKRSFVYRTARSTVYNLVDNMDG